MMDGNRAAGRPFDPYNFSEIEKIQSDIERDLQLDNPPPEMDSALPADSQLLEAPQLEELPLPADIPLHHVIPTVSEASASDFYTETIKQETPPMGRRFSSYRRLIIALLIICTLGAASLGIGIGLGISFWQQRVGGPAFGRGQIGIAEQIAGNNLLDDADASPVVGGSRFIFEGSGAGSVQEGTLADVVRLVDPAVVSVVPEFSNTFQNPLQPSAPFITDGIQRNREGSGIIFAKDEERVFIVTNNYVTRGANAVNILMSNQGPIPAHLVGQDDIVGLTVLGVYQADVHQAGITEISIAAFGDSDVMNVGDIVLAIGNAMGEGNSTTSGIISAGEKEIFDGRRTLRVLQTDAAINPGASGGPLVNKRGQVIGINIIAASTEHYAIEGMGFSVPSNVAKPVIERIMNLTPRPWLGIEGRNVNEEIAVQLGIPPIGVYVVLIIPDTGAEQAGIRRGDVITSFNGRPVFNFDQLREEIGRTEVGDIVEVTIIRQEPGHMVHLVLDVTLGEMNQNNF